MRVARQAQIIPNKKFANSLQYLQKEVNDEVDFSYACKDDNLLQNDTMILMGMVTIISIILKTASLQCLYNILKTKLEMKLMFCMQINIKMAYKLISTPSAPKFPTR